MENNCLRLKAKKIIGIGLALLFLCSGLLQLYSYMLTLTLEPGSWSVTNPVTAGIITIRIVLGILMVFKKENNLLFLFALTLSSLITLEYYVYGRDAGCLYILQTFRAEVHKFCLAVNALTIMFSFIGFVIYKEATDKNSNLGNTWG